MAINAKTSFRTDGLTDEQTDELTDSSTAICHPTGGIKRIRHNEYWTNKSLDLTPNLLIISMKSAKALPRYGSGHKSAGRTDRRKDGRTTPKQYPSAWWRG
ncbi:hypothetical protein DPMN_063666 [Dreissena polymorpha]|uniref:Uncharacterized protein n=1 Tax=Dreissena polymorpha TaxID=45954 RepID=A0A9D4CAY3_DREPO|nr:hypothetical protein DPMN_063666 [Dreissena polymorpha]